MIKAATAAALGAAFWFLLSASAHAAPQMQINGAPPAVMVPGSSGQLVITLTNVGDAEAASGALTVTADLPDEFQITGTSSPNWTGCSVDSSQNRVTCTGPTDFTTLPMGATQCKLFGFLDVDCPITVGVQVPDDAAKGAVDTLVEACVASVTPCSTVTRKTVIQSFGDQYGIAPINQPGAQSVAVIPETKAFWAGSCDRAAAPPFGDPIPAPGVGSLPSSIWAPAGEDGTNLAANRVLVPAPSPPPHCIDLGEPSQFLTSEPGVWFETPDWRLPPGAQAGSHPDGSSTIAWKRDAANAVDGTVDNIYVNLPSGFVGNPNGIDKCTQDEFADEPPRCPPASQVGILHLLIKARGFGAAGHGPRANYKIHPVWNLEPRKGRVAELGFAYASGERATSVRVSAKARTNGDFGVTAFTGQIPVALVPVIQTITLWGVPWDSANDIYRAPRSLYAGDVAPFPDCIQPEHGEYLENNYIPHSGFKSECRQSYDPSWGPVKPFVSQETDCNSDPVVSGGTDSYQSPGNFVGDGSPASGKASFLTADPQMSDADWKTATSAQAAVTGCEKLGFEPDINFGTTTAAADGSTGLSVDLDLPQNNGLPFDPPPVGAPQGDVDDYVDAAVAHWKSDDGLATAHLKDTVVTLPPGVSLNPSSAAGLVACDDATVGVRQQGNPPLFDNSDPSDGLDGDDCPDGSLIGTARVDTPLLDEPLTGEVILGNPKSTDPQSGEMLRTFLIVRSKDRGLIAKIYGSAKADPTTGRITATFANNPEVPFDSLHVEFKGGPRGLVAMPQRCGAPAWTAAFTPWSSVGASGAVPDAPDGGTFGVDADCGFGFAPSMRAGMNTSKARASGTFSFKFTRPQGQQWVSALTAKLPTGLLASVRDVPLCSDGQAASASCPASSKIGIVDASAGSGEPFVLEQKGEVFLTESYKGGEYGLAVKIRGVAGPFRGATELSPILVRQALHVDRTTAQVTAISDPFPLVHHGIPLRVREVNVLVDRSGFTVNPSDCSAKRVEATLTSPEGASASLASPFGATGCAALPFKPRLKLALTGRKQVTTSKHPGVEATVTQTGVGEAGIERAEVRLPKSLALDPGNAQSLCEFADGTAPNIEDRCPKGSIIGRARAVSPLLNEPLVGNVYFVKNIRRSSTGNLIRTLPMLIVALRGEIAINLKGESDTTKDGKLVNTFANVPDAPISQFNLNIAGGSNGILAVTRTKKARINLCTKPKSHVAETDMDGHNGKRHDFDVRMRMPCTKKQIKAAKRKAKRAPKNGSRRR